VPADLLEEVFDFNMALEEADADEIGVARERFADMRNEIDEQMLMLFARHDAAPDRATLEELRALLNRRRYIANLIATASGEGIRH